MPTQSNLMGAGCPALQAQASTGIVTSAATATGTTITDALQLPSDFVVFTTVGANTGAKMPPATAGNINFGDSYVIVNHGANTLKVYPATSAGKIANGSAGAAFSVASTKTVTIQNVGTDLWSAQLSA